MSGGKYHTPCRLNYALRCKIPDVNRQMLFLLFCLWWLAAKEFKSHPHSNCPSVTKSLLFRGVCLCRHNLCSMVGALGRGLEKGGENIFILLTIQNVVRLACAGCGTFSFFSWALNSRYYLRPWEEKEKSIPRYWKWFEAHASMEGLSPKKAGGWEAEPSKMSSPIEAVVGSSASPLHVAGLKALWNYM